MNEQKKMTEKIKNQYDSLYASMEVVFGGGKPVAAVLKLGEYIQSGTVLDIGGGEGRNALYLAEQGYLVSVTDLSEVGLNKLQAEAKARGLKINTQVRDVIADGIEGMYDAVINTFVLHHMDDENAKKVIAESQRHTKAGGVHILYTFMNEGGLYERNKKTGRFYPSEDALKDLYADWDIKSITTEEIATLKKFYS